jgi:Fic family protein
MFQPNYTLTNKIFNNVAISERLYGQIESLKLPEKLQLNLKRTNLVQSTYYSNKIEGNPMTLPEVTNLLLDDRVPVNRDEKEVANYFSMLEKLKEYKDKPLTVDFLTDIHKHVFEGVHEKPGQLRNEIVAVGRYTGEGGNVSFKVKHLPPFHAQAEIRQALEELLNWANHQAELPVVVKTGIFHHHFVYIHPFEDGNGRVCRILTALLFIKAGYRINKYFILDDYYDIDRILYSDKLHSADEGDKTEWLEYYSDGVKYSLQSALVKAQTALRTLSIAERPTAKEREVLEIMTSQPEITSTEVAQMLSVSRQQAHNLLSSLVEKGLIQRQGTTKSSYYVLK